MIRLAHAVYDENGKPSNGMPGDQTEREIRIQNWYSSGKGWQNVFRPKDPLDAQIIARTALEIAANNLIGYDQNDRLSAFYELEKVSFVANKLYTACETDCSAMVAICCNAAGIDVAPTMYTGNQKKLLKATNKFYILTDTIYLASAKYLQAGDILHRVGHTAIVIDVPSNKEIQELVNTFGYDLVLDGIIGRLSKAAIADLKQRISDLQYALLSIN